VLLLFRKKLISTSIQLKNQT